MIRSVVIVSMLVVVLVAAVAGLAWWSGIITGSARLRVGAHGWEVYFTAPAASRYLYLYVPGGTHSTQVIGNAYAWKVRYLTRAMMDRAADEQHGFRVWLGDHPNTKQEIKARTVHVGPAVAFIVGEARWGTDVLPFVDLVRREYAAPTAALRLLPTAATPGFARFVIALDPDATVGVAREAYEASLELSRSYP